MSRSTQPGGRAAAPGPLRLVQDFVNTNNIEDDTDELATPEAFRQWLVENHLLARDAAVGPDDLVQAVRIREAIRSLAAANNRGRLDPAAVAVLNEAHPATLGRIRFGIGGEAELEPQATDVDGALFVILAALYDAMLIGIWPRLKACRRDRCRWLFFDASRNRAGTWCAMTICGNKAKTSAYYRRQRQPRVMPQSDRAALPAP